MKQEEKEQILETIRKRHGIAIDMNDPLFAIVTANEIMIEKQLKEQSKHFTEQLIEMEHITNKYLTQSKELLEVKLSLAVKEAKEQLKINKKETKENKPNSFIRPILFIITGIIIGYTSALLIL